MGSGGRMWGGALLLLLPPAAPFSLVSWGIGGSGLSVTGADGFFRQFAQLLVDGEVRKISRFLSCFKGFIGQQKKRDIARWSSWKNGST